MQRSARCWPRVMLTKKPRRVFVKKYLARGMNVVELGGSIGVISSTIRSRIGRWAYHLVVEADPLLAGVCEHNASLNAAPDRCCVFQAAIDYSGASTVTFACGHNAHTGRLTTRDEQGLTVPAISLSEVAAALPPGPFALVCDIEGAEAEMIASKKSVFSAISTIVVGGHPVILPFLRGLGRRIYAAIFSFWTGVIPPLPMLGRS
ncbi:FkbM family methyltransferase [Thalassobacter stenotrophicus]|uniref:FkbM family methyltransferase n=1 Tax=Thalassobacter stenotrophicus TaxID=266809 RepID=UPI00398F951B